MNPRIRMFFVVVVTCALSAVSLSLPLNADDDVPGSGRPVAAVRAAAASPQDVADRIDQMFQAAWQSNQITAAPMADDSEFLRRVYLDLAGRIPSIAETREFLEDTRPDKRRLLVDELLDSPAAVRNLTIVLRNALIPQANSQVELRALIPGFEAWLWDRISQQTPYDVIVREIITTPTGSDGPPGGVLASASSPEAFFIVRERKPENLATGTSRAFLGVRIDCAQCHDHPFDHWKQQQFWNMAAFYSGFQPADATAGDDEAAGMQMMPERRGARNIRIPSTGEVVPAKFLTGQLPAWPDDDGSQVSSRQMLADWVTSDQNPYFARMAANRMWAQFFGRGIVHPIDDFSDTNPASHPNVLDLLGSQFIAHDYDLNFLARTITATQVYQASSRQTHASQTDETMFARAALRGLTPEQFFDSLAEAVGFYQPYRTANPFVLDPDSARSRFLELFRNDSESPLHHETTILQALAMINGEFVADATAMDSSQTLRAVADFPLMQDRDRLQTLFLATLSRFPSDDELAMFSSYLAEGGAAENSRAALGDIFWVLLNSSEFLLNH